MYLLKLALRPWRVTPFSQFLSVIAVSGLLISCAFVLWIERSLGPVVARLQGEQVITLYLNPENSEAKRITDSIRLTLGTQADRAEVKLVSPSEFLAGIQKRYPELARELEDLGEEANLVVPMYVSVSGVFASGTVEAFRKINGVESVESSSDRYRTVIGAFRAVRWVARFLIVGLVLALVSGLFHLIRLNVHLQQNALTILRFWGASNWFLRIPGIFSGLLAGLIGGGVAAAVFWVGGPWMASHIRALSPVLQDIPLQTGYASGLLLFAGIGIGILSGLLSGGVSSTAASDSSGTRI